MLYSMHGGTIRFDSHVINNGGDNDNSCHMDHV